MNSVDWGLSSFCLYRRECDSIHGCFTSRHSIFFCVALGFLTTRLVTKGMIFSRKHKREERKYIWGVDFLWSNKAVVCLISHSCFGFLPFLVSDASECPVNMSFSRLCRGTCLLPYLNKLQHSYPESR